MPSFSTVTLKIDFTDSPLGPLSKRENLVYEILRDSLCLVYDCRSNMQAGRRQLNSYICRTFAELQGRTPDREAAPQADAALDWQECSGAEATT